jgi:hypothetical protein
MKKLVLASLLFCAATAPAADIVWTNLAGGAWATALNWNPNQVPSGSDTAWITNNGTYTVTVSANATATNLVLGGTSGTQTINHTAGTFTLTNGASSSLNGVYTLNGGTLAGSGTLALAGPFNWTAGILGNPASSFFVRANGGLAISGATLKTFGGGTLVNETTGTWTGGQVSFNTGVSFSNAPAATFDLLADGSAIVLNGTPASLANSGTFRKTSGTGVTTISTPFNNFGFVDVQTGTLALIGGGTNTGQFTNSSAASVLRFGGGIHTILDTSSISGQGIVSLTTGTLNVQGNLAVGALTNSGTLNFNTLNNAYVTNLTVTGGTLAGSNSVILPGLFTWTGGVIGSPGAPLILVANAGLSFSGATKTMNGGTIVNNAAGTWTAGPINCNSGVFSNAPSGTFDLAADGIAFSLNSGSPLLANAGLLRKTAGSGTTTIGVACNNSSLVQVQSGILTLNNGGTSSGQFTTLTGTTLNLGGTHLFQGSSSVSGPGSLSVASGTATVQGAISVNWLTNSGNLNFNQFGTVYPTNFMYNGASLTGSNTVQVAGLFSWTVGSFGSAGSGFTVAANGAMTISGAGAKTLQGGTLLNGGSGTWINGNVNCNGTAVFNNALGATFDLQGDGASFTLNSGTPVFVNAGTLRKMAGTGTSTISMPCANSGSVQVNSGTLSLALTDGTGAFTPAAGSTLMTSGTATLSGTASISGPGNFEVTNGFLTNHGTLNIGGTNTFSGGVAKLDGICIITNTPLVISGGNVLFSGTGTLTPSSVNFASGTLQGTMAMTVSGPFSWTGGNFGVAGSTLFVVANGGISLSANGKNFVGGTLVNAGPGSWSGGLITCNGGVFSNAPSATFDLQANGTSFGLNSGTPLFANAGILRKVGGTGTASITIGFANSGSVQVNTGVLSLTLTDGSGSFTPAAGTTLMLTGAATLTGSASISGPGNFEVVSGFLTNHGTLNIGGTNTFSGGNSRFDGTVLLTNAPLVVSGGTVTFTGTGSITPSILNLSLGILQGSMPITVLGPTLWSGGTIGGGGPNLVLSANGGLAISGITKTLSGTLVNNGVGTWTNGQVGCNSAAFSNAASAVLDFLGDGSFFAQNSGNSILVNNGTMRKTGGTGLTSITCPSTNSGTLQANTGTLTFTTFTQNGGQTVLSGGNFLFSLLAQFLGGSINGNGTITGSISNNATVSPGASPGLLTITGNYTEGPNSHLQIELGGTSAGVTYDQLAVGGTAKLTGTLEVSYWNSFVPALGNIFTALVCNARSGAFSFVQAPTNTLGTIYTAKSVLLEPGNVSPSVTLAVNQAPTVCHNFFIQASGSDPDGAVTNLSIFQDTNLLLSAASSSAQLTLSYDFPGDLTFTAIATDNKGASGATNVTVSITPLAELVLDPIGFQTNRAFKLCMTGEAGTNYEIQASTNLAATNWTVLGVMQNTNGIWRYSDVTATNSAFRVYRARQLP